MAESEMILGERLRSPSCLLRLSAAASDRLVRPSRLRSPSYLLRLSAAASDRLVRPMPRQHTRRPPNRQPSQTLSNGIAYLIVPRLS
jgi:hypothetical protein